MEKYKKVLVFENGDIKVKESITIDGEYNGFKLTLGYKYFDENKIMNWKWNIFSWFVGFLVYQLAGLYDSIFFGPTLLSIIVSALLAYAPVLVKKTSKHVNHN